MLNCYTNIYVNSNLKIQAYLLTIQVQRRNDFMRKKIRIGAVVITACLLINVAASTAFASDDASAAAASVDGVFISGKSAVLMDSSTKKVLMQKNSHEKINLASVTKIMTMLLAMEKLEAGAISLTDMVTVSTHASQMGGSQIWLKEGEKMSVNDLLKATAVASANDAAMALAEHISGSQEEFVLLMNQRAQELLMVDTHFVNPTGLDEKDHYSCAYDIAIMTAELLKHDLILDYTKIWMDSLRGGKTELVNTNKLIRFYKGATGMKTGTTNDAGSCISATATRGDMGLIAVVMGCKTSVERFDDAKRMLDFGFASFVIYKPVANITNVGTVKIINGVVPQAKLSLAIDEKIVVMTGKKIVEEVSLIEQIEAPISAGQKLGEVTLKVDNQTLYTYDVTSANDVEKMSFSHAFSILLKRFVEL